MKRLQGKRTVITQVGAFMGKDLMALFQSEGADVIAANRDLRLRDAAEALIGEAGEVDVLFANLAAEQPRTSALDTTDETFRAMYEAMVFPLHRLVRAVLPQMIERRRGKTVVIGSASGLKGMANYSAYGSARGTQLAYVQTWAQRSRGGRARQCNCSDLCREQNLRSRKLPEHWGVQGAHQRRADRTIGAWVGIGCIGLVPCRRRRGLFVGQVFPFSGGWITR
ncbi:SDR family NAD(P)-dependent oxidoreductase [Bradyrhizobium icense]|uniref:SDR family NAD(P)-dependent oxidoreductase n=1 Tax=Bradyrhizobium icense TaxID=1274631 RepID=UPI0009F54DC0|nr:SDR family oxidoreductase [Bradyrhizobium icense]